MNLTCRCGETVRNVPDHLADLATWICDGCRNKTGLPDFRFKLNRARQKNPAFNPGPAPAKVTAHPADLGY